MILAAGTVSLQAQDNNKAFAVTSETNKGVAWTAIREIDLSSGDITKTHYDSLTRSNFSIVGNTKILTNGPVPNTAYLPLQDGVAALAYDKTNNRLYFTPMHGNELRYFDMNTPGRIVYVQSQLFSLTDKSENANIISRMAFAADGNGYALSNDGNELIRFTNDAQPVISNLGSLVDGSKNSDSHISVHNACTSWGGDMIGDIYGNLYLFTVGNNVFKINIQTMEADFVGTIKNLPPNFSINGAAADLNGDVFISSANSVNSYYHVDLPTMTATPVVGKGDVYNVADLANSNLIFQNKNLLPNTPTAEPLNTGISLYPNPAIGHYVTIQFGKIPPGIYSIQLSDASGNTVLTKTITVSGAQNERINLPKTATGLHLVKISAAGTGKTVFVNKVLVL